jgi:hypothetical protein
VYALIMTATVARNMADTVDYAGSIRSALGEGSRGFWEFGHLFWRPLGYVGYRVAAPLLERKTGSDALTEIVAVLLAWNWLAGLVGALALNRFVVRLGARPWSVAVVTVAYVVTFGVLNYAHSGSSYVPGLACLLVGLACLVARNTIAAGTAVAAGTALACAVGFWAPYILVMPAALAFPLVWCGLERCRVRQAVITAAAFVVVLSSAYLVAIQRLGIHDLAGLKSWIKESSHEIVGIGGISRTAFGVPRSFISMGKDGVLFKRFLLKDPYNPVNLRDLIRLSLAKLTFVYVVLLATVVGQLRGKVERRLLVAAILAVIPVLAFAVSWQGGDVERYMPVYPFVWAAWALVMGPPVGSPVRLVQALVLSFVVVMSIVNVPALSRVIAERERVQLQHRIEPVLATVGPHDRVYVILIQDPLFGVKRDPLSTYNRDLEVGVLVPVGYASTPNWRREFAADVERAWAKGGTVWISKRVFSQRPKAEWGWVEGDDKSVSWSDLPSFFGAFELGQDLGDEDGFVVLARTTRNERLLAESATPQRTDPSMPRDKKAA